MTKILGFDLDGVLYGWHEMVYNELVRYHGLTESYYDFWTNWRTSSISSFTWKNLCGIESLYGCKKALPETLRVVRELSKRFSIVYITQRPAHCYLATKNWLKREGFPQQHNLFVVDNKEEIVDILGLDYYIEDKVSNVELLNKYTKVIMKRQPWNSFFNYEPAINNLSELLEMI